MCVDRGHLDEYLRCQDTIQALRTTKCAGRSSKSLMEALKTDLDCGSTAGVGTLRAPAWFLLSTLLAVPLLHRRWH